MFKNHHYFLSLFYRLSDLIALNLAFLLGVQLRFGNDDKFSFLGENYPVLLFFINLTWLFISSARKIYLLGYFSSKRRYLFAILFSIGIHLLITTAFNGLIKTFYSRLFLMFTFVSFTFLLFITRKIVYLLYHSYVKKSAKLNSIVLIGNGSDLTETLHFLKGNSFNDLQKIEITDSKKVDYEFLDELNKNTPISEIYIPLSEYKEEELENLSIYCDNNFIRLRLIFDWKKLGSRKLNLTKFNQTTILRVALTPLDDPYNSLLKRVCDIFISSFLMIFIFSWLFPIIALIIKLESKGTVFFKQKRSGAGNKDFDCFKFRSMRKNEEADSIQAIENDPRITKVGKFLRKTYLDELPQFFNVLKGEMSIVGPRPHMLRHTKEYSEMIGNFMNRHAIKPGITGLAQVKGYKGEINGMSDLQNRVRLDRFYVNNWSFLFDLQVMLFTFSTVIKENK